MMKENASDRNDRLPDSDTAVCQSFEDFYIDNMDLPYGTSMPYFQYHNVYELFYVKRGHKRYIIGGEAYDMQPYELVIVRPGEIHRTVSRDNIPQSRLILYFSEAYFDRYRDIIDEYSLFDCLKAHKLTVPAQHRLSFTKLLNRITSMDNEDLKDRLRYAKMQCYMFELLCKLAEIASIGTRIIKSNALIERALEYIGKNYRSNLTLTSVAEEVFVSPSYFSALFRECTGIGFSAYLRDLRVGRAIELLTDTDMSVSEISAECGFSSPNYFKDVFRQAAGVSPSQYRREAAEEYNPKFKPPDEVPRIRNL